MNMIQVGDHVDIDVFEYTGPATVSYIDTERLYNNQMSPIQCEIKPEHLSGMRAGYAQNGIIRVSLKDLNIQVEAPPLETQEEGQLSMF